MGISVSKPPLYRFSHRGCLYLRLVPVRCVCISSTGDELRREEGRTERLCGVFLQRNYRGTPGNTLYGSPARHGTGVRLFPDPPYYSYYLHHGRSRFCLSLPTDRYQTVGDSENSEAGPLDEYLQGTNGLYPVGYRTLPLFHSTVSTQGR